MPELDKSMYKLFGGFGKKFDEWSNLRGQIYRNQFDLMMKYEAYDQDIQPDENESPFFQQLCKKESDPDILIKNMYEEIEFLESFLNG